MASVAVPLHHRFAAVPLPTALPQGGWRGSPLGNGVRLH
ncbi:hypothetical protein HDC35_001465 [Sphingopyxis sp. JAI128]|nr:hypothetical protein [Sphingopyxis sp. JAI128]